MMLEACAVVHIGKKESRGRLTLAGAEEGEGAEGGLIIASSIHDKECEACNSNWALRSAIPRPWSWTSWWW